MKKRMISLALVLALLTMLLPGGSFGGMEVFAAGKSVSSISVKSKPSKLSYKVGDKLATKGLKITVRYSNKTTKTLTSGFTCSPVKLSKAGTQKITVNYKGKKTSFNVTVSKVVKSVRIKSKPSKLSYKTGESLSTKGMKLTVTYTDKTTKTVTGGFTCSPTRFTKAGTQKITVKYGGKSTSFNVRVTKAASQSNSSKRNNMKYIKNPDYKSPYYIVVYTGSQSAVVYGKNSTGGYSEQIKSFTVSTGKKDSTPTRKGMYKIRAKYRWKTLMGPCYGQYSCSISSSYLFHSVPYHQTKVNSLYDSYYDKLGKDASHGCIRMCVRDCKWIYDNCPIGTQVRVVWESGPKGAGVPPRLKGAKYSGWDPTDKWAKGNPYFANNGNASTTTTTASTCVYFLRAAGREDCLRYRGQNV